MYEAYQNINKPTKTDEVTTMMRSLCAKRACTQYYCAVEAEKAGLKDDAWMDTAMKQYGYDTARAIEANMKDPGDLEEFAQNFGVGLDRDIYEMETGEQNAERFSLHFHYCPFVTKWIEMGVPEEQLPRLCYLAMGGDRGVGEVFEAKHGIRFTLGKTIAQGNPTCDLLFEKIADK